MRALLRWIFSISWDEWRGSLDGRPSMLVKCLLDFAGYRVDLHKFIRADDPTCFHTHPANAIRIVFWGGYEEEIHGGMRIDWRPGDFGVVHPELCHRVSKILNGSSSYSLWLRGRKTNKAKIIGEC
jgi:hypothetical protein